MYTGGIFEVKKEIPVYCPFASEARRGEFASRGCEAGPPRSIIFAASLSLQHDYASGFLVAR
jgi:hypothetical protein